jgi:hypothetical protein
MSDSVNSPSNIQDKTRSKITTVMEHILNLSDQVFHAGVAHFHHAASRRCRSFASTLDAQSCMMAGYSTWSALIIRAASMFC